MWALSVAPFSAGPLPLSGQGDTLRELLPTTPAHHAAHCPLRLGRHTERTVDEQVTPVLKMTVSGVCSLSGWMSGSFIFVIILF